MVLTQGNALIFLATVIRTIPCWAPAHLRGNFYMQWTLHVGALPVCPSCSPIPVWGEAGDLTLTTPPHGTCRPDIERRGWAHRVRRVQVLCCVYACSHFVCRVG